MKHSNEKDIETAVKSKNTPPRKWCQWKMYNEGNKTDKESFKTLCRLMYPKRKLIEKKWE